MQPLSDDENNKSEGEEKKPSSEEDPYAGLPPLKRPRKTVYKSTLQKRNREKRRRELFQEGLQQLSELVFQSNPSVASGRNIQLDAAPTITNRGDLVRAASESMTRLIYDVAEQKNTITELEERLARKKLMINAFSQTNPLDPLVRPETIDQIPTPVAMLPNINRSTLALNRLISNQAPPFQLSNMTDSNLPIGVFQYLQSQGQTSLDPNPNYSRTHGLPDSDQSYQKKPPHL